MPLTILQINDGFYLQPQWPAPPHIHAFTTTRHFGNSQGAYGYFNLSTRVGDNSNAVLYNQQKLIADLHLPCAPQWLQQIHGNQCVVFTADHSDKSFKMADACLTTEPGILCAVLTADCLPIVICNQAGNEIAAIHAGWRGLLKGVINNTIANLQSKASQLMAWLGPCIGPSHFEINATIEVDFIKNSPHNIHCFYKTDTGKVFADLASLARQNLLDCGISQVFGGNHCTFSEQQWFYSYRRDHQVTGRMATLIWIQPS